MNLTVIAERALLVALMALIGLFIVGFVSLNTGGSSVGVNVGSCGVYVNAGGDVNGHHVGAFCGEN